ncbi:uncharacterized protein TNCV_2221271 [Trichonephila clavipes]|nr:uncharacterized protein TNCV_2221271 [Trichonephila clavipes]
MYLEDFKNKIEFHYHLVVKRVNIKTKGQAKIFLDEGVSELLVFEPGEIKGKVESPYIAEPNASFPLIYVYCDLVEPQIVGDIQAPLLKIVKVEGKDGEVVNLFKRDMVSEDGLKDYIPFCSTLFISRSQICWKRSFKNGAQIANDLLEGRNLQESAEERAKETGRILAKKAIKKADDMLGKGKAYKRKKKLPKYLIQSKVRKKKRRDIFDTQ